MAILYYNSARDRQHWAAVLTRAVAPVEVRCWPDIGDPAAIDYLVMWGSEPGLISGLPNVKAIFSLGAGANHILAAPDLPSELPVIRLENAGMGRQMAEYALFATLAHQRQMIDYRCDQGAGQWRPRHYVPAQDVGVGILGLGVLGGEVAQMLQGLGYAVSGWSRRPKSVPGIANFHGDWMLPEFLGGSNVLICILPLTTETVGVLNGDLFDQLPDGAMVVNMGRGDHMVESDLLAALDRGKLSAAVLDVFGVEPLPASHPFWTHERILMTPHVAAETQAEPACRQIAENLERLKRGETPRGLVDRAAGY